MASVLFYSKQGDGVPLALRLASEGAIVKMFVEEKSARGGLQGYRNPSVVPNVQMLEQYDLVLFDMVGLGQRAEALKSKGRLVLGGGTFHDKLELDREYGQKVVKQLTKLKVPEGKLIKTKDELIKELESSTEPLVLKPQGNKEVSLTLVSSDNTNRTLISIVDTQADKLTPCILQKRINGIEISTEGWFNGKEWAPCFNHTLEHKRLMEGEKGPQTGCMGNTVWMCQEDELVKMALLPLAPLLKKVEYIGPLDVNCILTEDEAYFLEFTTRFGYDAIQALSELYKGKMFDFLWKVASQDSSMDFRSDYSFAVRMSMPPYPIVPKEGLKEYKGVQVLDIENGARNHVFLADVMLKDDVECLAGIDGVIGCVTARGETIQEVRRRVYRTLDRIVIHQDVQYRKDIGSGVEEKISRLKEWGWL